MRTRCLLCLLLPSRVWGLWDTQLVDNDPSLAQLHVLAATAGSLPSLQFTLVSRGNGLSGDRAAVLEQLQELDQAAGWGRIDLSGV